MFKETLRGGGSSSVGSTSVANSMRNLIAVPRVVSSGNLFLSLNGTQFTNSIRIFAWLHVIYQGILQGARLFGGIYSTSFATLGEIAQNFNIPFILKSGYIFVIGKKLIPCCIMKKIVFISSLLYST